MSKYCKDIPQEGLYPVVSSHNQSCNLWTHCARKKDKDTYWIPLFLVLDDGHVLREAPGVSISHHITSDQLHAIKQNNAI